MTPVQKPKRKICAFVKSVLIAALEEASLRMLGLRFERRFEEVIVEHIQNLMIEVIANI